MINLDNKNILVVEDDDMNFIYLRQVFKVIKGNLVRVKSGRAGIDACNNQQFDVILMDLKLPDISGYEATQEIRKTNSTIPIIVQTASILPEDHDEALKSGCNFVLVKPFKIDELSEVLSKVIVD
jgi:CheY-like chemotaxis protein